MKRFLLRVLVFIAVAVGTAFLVNKLNNAGLDRVSKELDEPTLPYVYLEFDGKVINRTCGYTQTMSTSLMREGIVPLNSSHGVTALVDNEGKYGETFTYELRSIAGDSLVERGDATAGNIVDGRKRYDVNFRMDMQPNREYVFVFIITAKDGTEVRYYNRVVNLSEQHAREIIDFATDFHNTTFVKKVNEAEGNIVFDHLKTDKAGTTSSLAHVDLNATYEQITWGGLNPVVVTGVIPTITEVDKEYAVIHMSYVAESVNDAKSHYYQVDEYYNATYDRSAETVNLLAFDRYQESFFDSGYISKDRNSISMGVTNEEAEYVTSADYNILAFVRLGQLWMYNYSTNELTNIFSYPQDSFSDARTLNTNLDINIADMDEDGNIYFVVYGYMNRGEHEGKNGMSLYYYSTESMTTKELFFVECDESYDIMKKETGRFTYYNAQADEFYYLLDETLYKVSLADMTQTALVTDIPSAKYLVSANRKLIAYPNAAAEDQVTVITIQNFETGESYEKTCANGDLLLALGFVENDLIYGIAHGADVITTSDGQAILPLYELFIMSDHGEQKKDYTKDGVYIMNASVGQDTIYLTRARKQNQFFEEIDQDYISYKKEQNNKMITTTTTYDSYAWDILDVVFPSNIYLPDSASYRKTKYSQSEFFKEMQVTTKTRAGTYYVFDNAGYKGEYETAGSAITRVVEDEAGLVVDSNGNTIYRCLAADSYNTVADAIKETPNPDVSQSLLTCAYMCADYAGGTLELSDAIASGTFEKVFEDYTNGVGINISGISLSTALYFLDRDIPFAARIDDGRYVLVISYNSTHIRYYDPVLGEEVKVTRKVFENSLSLQSNTMYTFSVQ